MLRAEHTFRLVLLPQPTELTNVPLPVEGEFPDWLNGVLVRNGPGTFTVGGREMRHTFDGLAQVQSYQIGNGEVTYTNRFLKTDTFRHVQDHGELDLPQFSVNPS